MTHQEPAKAQPGPKPKPTPPKAALKPPPNLLKQHQPSPSPQDWATVRELARVPESAFSFMETETEFLTIKIFSPIFSFPNEIPLFRTLIAFILLQLWAKVKVDLSKGPGHVD